MQPSFHYLIAHINHAGLDVVVDLLGRLHERLQWMNTADDYFFDVRCRLGGGLQKDQTVLFRELLSLLRRHGTTMLNNQKKRVPVI